MSIEAMKQALEALEKHKPKISESSLAWITHYQAITALRTAIAEAEKQEPVAWMDCEGDLYRSEPDKNWCPPHYPLYITPPAAQPCPYIRSTAEGTHHCALSQRQPLTDDRIGQIIEQCKITLVNYCSGEKQTEFARAIEAAHGIKENT